MTTEELKNLIIEKQDNLIRLLRAPRYYEFWDYEFLDTVLRLSKELDALNQLLRQAKSESVKELEEIKEKHNCKNCYYELITRQYNPCDICSDFDKWEPKTK